MGFPQCIRFIDFVVYLVSFGTGLRESSNSSFYTMFVRFLQLAAEWAGNLA